MFLRHIFSRNYYYLVGSFILFRITNRASKPRRLVIWIVTLAMVLRYIQMMTAIKTSSDQTLLTDKIIYSDTFDPISAYV